MARSQDSKLDRPTLRSRFFAYLVVIWLLCLAGCGGLMLALRLGHVYGWAVAALAGAAALAVALRYTAQA